MPEMLFLTSEKRRPSCPNRGEANSDNARKKTFFVLMSSLKLSCFENYFCFHFCNCLTKIDNLHNYLWSAPWSMINDHAMHGKEGWTSLAKQSMRSFRQQVALARRLLRWRGSQLISTDFCQKHFKKLIQAVSNSSQNLHFPAAEFKATELIQHVYIEIWFYLKLFCDPTIL